LKTQLLSNLFLGFLSLALTQYCTATVFTAVSITGGNWNQGATWGSVHNPGSVNVDFPGTGDTAYLPAGKSVTIPSSYTAHAGLLSLDNNDNAASVTLTFASSSSALNIGGNVKMNTYTTAGSFSGTIEGTITMNGGTMTVGGNFTATAEKTNNYTMNQTITLGGGSLTISGNATFSHNGGGSAKIDMSTANSYFTIGGTLTLDGFNNGSGTSGTINYSGSGSQTVLSAITYNNLVISGTGTQTLNGSITVDSIFTITNGTMALATYTLSVAGNSTFTSGAINNGSVSTTGTNTTYSGTTFDANVTANSANVYLNGSTFNGTLSATRSGSASSNITSNGGNTFNGTTTITCTGTGSWLLANVNADTYDSSVTFVQTSSGDLRPAYNAACSFKKNISTTGSTTAITFSGGSSGSVILNGTVAQSINGSSSYPPTFNRLSIDNTSNSITLNVPISISSSLTLTAGNIITTSTNLLTLNNGATSSAGSASSFISGPVKKIGNSAFTFAVGNSSDYQPLSISAPASSSDAFTGQYFKSNQSLGSTLDTGIANLSTCEYWTLNQTAGADNVSVTLGWNSSSCNALSTVSNMRVAEYKTSTSKWTDEGGINATGNQTSGTITSNAALTSYGSLTLADAAICKVTPGISTNATICIGTSTTLTASGGTIYTWSPSTGLSSTSISNPVANLLTTTSYTVTISNSQGCSATASVTVTVNAPSASTPSTISNTDLVWSGLISTDWSVAGNWLSYNGSSFSISSSKPTNSLNVFIRNYDGCVTNLPHVKTTLENVKNLTIDTSTTLYMDSLETLQVYGNFTNNGSFISSYGTISLNGSSVQTIGGRNNTTFFNLTANSSGSVQLNSPETVSGTLTLTSGIVTTTSTNFLTLNNGSATTSASSSSFINGPVLKIGNSAFTFPIGNGTDYQPISISSPANSTDAFTAQYFNSNQILGNTLDTGIINLSRCEYWTLNQTAGTDNVAVTLGWNSSSCNVASNDTTMRIAEFKTASGKWTDLGGANPTGNSSAGTISSSANLNTYGAITLVNGAIGAGINYTWNGSVSSAWGNDTNWTPKGVPTAYGNVIIVNSSNQPIYNGVSGGVNNLTMNSGTLSLGNDTVPSPFNVAGNLTLDGGTMIYGLALNIIGNVYVNGSDSLNVNTTINGNLNLIQGILSSNSVITLTNTSSVTGGSSSSFISGGVIKEGNTAFTFPIGKGNLYKPLTITAPANSTDSFAAEYFNAPQTFGTNQDNSITGISTCEYWLLVRPQNTSTVSVTLNWTGSSCGITANDSNMRVAVFDTTTHIWRNEGGINPTGDSLAGSITSANPLPIYGPITLSNKNPCNMTLNISSDTSICKGGSVNLFANGGVSYNWMPTTGLSSGTSPTPVATPTVSTTYTVTATSSSGCTLTESVTLTVISLPIVGATASQNTVCSGNYVTLSGSGGLIYEWSDSVINGVAFAPTSSKTYTVIGIDKNRCANSDTIKINVIPIFSVTASASTNPVCYGNSEILIGGGAHSYSWTGGVLDGVAFNPNSSSTYTVIGTDVSGCTSTSSVTVVVKPAPFISISSSANSVCSGNLVTLTGYGAISYSWTNGVTNGIPFAPSATSTYTVTGTDSSGCTGTSTLTVTVNPLPNAQAGTSTTICPNTSVSLSASGGTSYHWLPANSLNNSLIAAPIASPNATTTYTVNVSNGTCTSSSTVTITVNSSPPSGISVNPSRTITPGGDINTIYIGHGAQSLTLTARIDANTTNYYWTSSSSLSCTNCLVTTASPNVTTTYTFTAIDSNGCTTVSSITIYVVNLGVMCSHC